MATLSDANVNAVIPQVWDMKVLQARVANATILKNVLNESSQVEEYGVIVHIATKPRASVGTTNTDGGFTPSALTLIDVQVNVNQWRYVAHTITDKQARQAIVTLETELASQFGELLSEQDEITLANLFMSLTGFNGAPGQGIGTPGTGQDFDEDMATAMIKSLRQRQINIDEMSFQLSPSAFYNGWLKRERLSDANRTGAANNPLIVGIKGYKMMVGGVPAFESTLLNGAGVVDPDTNVELNPASNGNVAGTGACALIHQESLAIAVQINGKYEKVRTTPALQFATLITGQLLYGANVNRANHGIVAYVKN